METCHIFIFLPRYYNISGSILIYGDIVAIDSRKVLGNTFFLKSWLLIIGIVLIKNWLMLSDNYCYSSLLIIFQYYQNNLIKSLSEIFLSVLWLGLILIISEIESIITLSFIDLNFLKHFPKPYNWFVSLSYSEFCNIRGFSSSDKSF